jgi:superfamily I DNA/RNA helicase
MSTSVYLEAALDLQKNEDQWQAYESNGNCVVLAGPGSGKTKVLTTKIARLLAEDVRSPRRLACITYSNACVGELQRRLRRLGVADDPRLQLSTVHSFFLTELVLPYAAIAGLPVPTPFAVASPARSRQIYERAYKKVLGGTPPNWYRIEFDKVRRTVLDRSGDVWKNWPGDETRIVEVYEGLLKQEGLIDFDGIVLTGFDLVRRFAWVRQSLRAKYPILVIDEYQDLGVPLHRMVRILMKEAGIRVLAVGDPDQSIYGFIGAQPGLLRKLAASPGVSSVQLKLNYRCADQIIAASRTLLSNPTKFKSHDGRKGEIRILKTNVGVRGQAEVVLKKILPLLQKSNPELKPGDLAILYRSYNEGSLVAAAADSAQIRYFRSDNGSPIKRSRLMDWLAESARWCSGAWRTGEVSLGQILKTWRMMRRSVVDAKTLLTERAQLIAMLFRYRDKEAPLREWLEAVDKAALGESFWEETGLADEKEHFGNLMKSAHEGVLRHYDVEMFGNHGRHPDQVNLMTLHSCKGLEFRAVAIVGLEEGEFPSNWDNTKAKVDEARRLFYVGLTRAKDTALLLYCSDESEFITQVRKATST